MDFIIKTSEKPIVNELTDFLKTLSENDKKAINIFIQGMKFAQAAGISTYKKSA